MLYDSLLEFSDAQDIASGTLSSGSTVVSELVRDLGSGEKDAFGGALTPDIGNGGELHWHVIVTNEAFVGASAQVVCTLVSKASSASISSGGTTHATITIPAASAIGTWYSVPVPPGTLYRYLGVLYTASGGNLTAGNVDSFLATAPRQIVD